MPSTKDGRILTASLGVRRTARNCRKVGLRAITPTSAAAIRRRSLRLSDISLQWMLEEILKLDHPIKFGPVTINGEHKGSRALAPRAHLCISTLTLRACSTARLRGRETPSMHSVKSCPRGLRWILAHANYQIIKRAVLPNAVVHSSVMERFKLETVIDCAQDRVTLYRPEALRNHNDFKTFYPDPPPADAPPAGRSETALPTQLP